MKQIEARGLACPEPVVLVQKGIAASPEGLCVTVDNFAAVENISRFAKARGYEISKRESGRETSLTLRKK